MNRDPKPEGYETKPQEYFQLTRPEMLQFVPNECKRVLDVGCGSGGFGQTLKQSRQVEVWGVEPVAAAAAIAATRLDHVVESTFHAGLDIPRGSFDCVVFNDVVEHLLDPISSLKLAHTFLSPGGCIVASIPNIRHFPTMWALLVRKEWTYRDFGILDHTHLRFFTQKSIPPLFCAAGFSVERLKGINTYRTLHPKMSPRWRFFVLWNVLTLGAISDMRYLQFAVVARPSKNAKDPNPYLAIASTSLRKRSL